MGRADPSGGRADVYLDGVKQLCGHRLLVPPGPRPTDSVLQKRTGARQARLKSRGLGREEPAPDGTRVYVDAVQWSAAQGEAGFGEGGGSADAQRVIFGYVGRKDYVDSKGHSWRPAMEFVMRLQTGADLVPISFWTEPRIKDVANTNDPELYRYGVHGRDFTAYFTVNPQSTYYARIKLCQPTAPSTPGQFATTIDLQGKTVATDVDIAATAGGLGKAVDLVFNDVRPTHGIIAVRFRHRSDGEAMVQAIEVGPGQNGPGARPLQAPPSSAVGHGNH